MNDRQLHDLRIEHLSPARSRRSYLLNVTWPVCVANAETVPTQAGVHVELIVPANELALALSGPFAVIEQVGILENAPAGIDMLAVSWVPERVPVIVPVAAATPVKVSGPDTSVPLWVATHLAVTEPP